VGPLKGFRIIEIAGLGPGPFCGMLLADMGAEVVCVERNAPSPLNPDTDCFRRGKRSILLDLKSEADRDILLRLVERADALFEGFRPGVMERLGLGPDDCAARNPRLVYGRMTGWGQTGPLSKAAGHDINYIALTGGLHATGPAGGKPSPPVPPAGDFGGGAMFLAFGLVCALLEAQSSERGQVVDAAITDGSAVLMSLVHSLHAQGMWSADRGGNLLDGGAPFYGVYETRDGKFVAIGALEPQFQSVLAEAVGMDPDGFRARVQSQGWTELHDDLAAVFLTRTRDEWRERLEGTDTCFAPVLDFQEAPNHPHHSMRNTYLEVDGIVQPAPAPRFSRTEPGVAHGPPAPGADTENILRDWGVSPK
jgi:alpha-methylacyl-CoA racemase